MIRLATINDVDEITNVHIASWQSAYKRLISDEVLSNPDREARKKMWSTAIQQYPQETIVATEGNQIIGFSNFGNCRDNKGDENTAEIRAIYLLEPYWRKGVGSVVLERSIKTISASGYTALVLWILKTNSRAISFYKKHGFKIDGHEKTETHWGVELNEIRMSKPF